MTTDDKAAIKKPETIFDVTGKYSGYVVDSKKVDPTSYLQKDLLRDNLPINDISEVQVVRHYTHLSRKNYGVDLGFYPLGSCTMKYNPKVNEDMAVLPGFANQHPFSSSEDSQGALELLHNLEEYLCEITGMDSFTLQPAAGAHGELTALMVAAKHFRAKGEARNEIVVPDSSHGTNPASAAMCGFSVKEIASNKKGFVDLKLLRESLSEKTGVFMLTHPNTLGLFEENIGEVADIVHANGSLLYCDGANMNAMLGITRPGDQGFDMLHLNLHKTFSTPHGGGGPGSGPVGVKKGLEQFLPVPRVVKKSDGMFALDYDRKDSIGSVRAFYGNFLVAVKAYSYILGLGPRGLARAGKFAVLNANYIKEKLRGHYDLPYSGTCGHEVVFSCQSFVDRYGIHTTDVVKRLIDFGIHPPTIYFPLIVHEAMMIEPTETESRQTLDHFIEVMKLIAKECRENPEMVKSAPHSTPVSRLDGVLAARKPDVRFGSNC